MAGLIPTDRPVIGEDLDVLRERLGLSTADANWLYGLSMTKWMTIVKKSPKEPVRNASLALLVRILGMHPELNPVPSTPRAQEIFGLIAEHMPQIDKKRMAIMFGCEASSGYRWITVESKISPVQARLFMVFKKLYAPISKKSSHAALTFLAEWDRMVEHEAIERGVSNVFSVGKWTTASEAYPGRPVIGEDLDILRERLGLGTLDACWLFGMSMNKWTLVVKKNAKEVVRNPTLALLVRVLTKYPAACPITKAPDATEVFDRIKEFQPLLDKKRMAIMFGCEASSGYRWLTVKSKIGPVLQRTFKVFMARYEPLAKRSASSAMAALSEWDRMVSSEASARGVANVYSTGRWSTSDVEEDDQED